MKWEYKVVAKDKLDEAHLNELGEDGWELCAMSHEPGYAPRIVFKRQKVS